MRDLLLSMVVAAGLGAVATGCGSPAEPVPEPDPVASPLERGTSEDAAPPLGKPRPKIVPGDVVDEKTPGDETNRGEVDDRKH